MVRNPFRRPSSASEEEPIDWLITMRNSERPSATQREAFESWRADPDKSKAYARLEDVADRLKAGIDDPDVARMRKESIAWAKMQRRKGRRSRFALAVAACLVISLGTALHYSDWRLPALPWEKPVEKTYMTAIGQRSSVPLEDGSVLTLDTDTSVSVTFGKERAVILRHGQALFDVAKGDKRPFAVYAGDRRVVATGTSFDVRFEQKTITVALIEGHVVIDVPPSSGQTARPAELQPGETFVAALGGSASVSRVNLESITGWTAGKHIFRGVPLSDALLEVNRYTDAPISLGDRSLGSLTIMGVFPTGRPNDFAQMVAAANGLKLSRDAQGHIVLIKGTH